MPKDMYSYTVYQLDGDFKQFTVKSAPAFARTLNDILGIPDLITKDIVTSYFTRTGQQNNRLNKMPKNIAFTRIPIKK